MKLKTVNAEVLYAEDRLVSADLRDIESLKERAASNPRKRARICAHPGVDDLVHEMLIVHEKNTYIRPHKHLNKAESIHVIEGLADLVIFNESGGIVDVLQMGHYLSARDFFCRMPDGIYHTLLIHSDVLVFHETTSGPFSRADTAFAPWAPDDTDEHVRAEFFRKLQSESKGFLKLREDQKRH